MQRANTHSRASSNLDSGLPTFEEINKKFIDAQTAQDDIFDRTRRQQRVKFISTITALEEGGNKRDKEFSDFTRAVNATYMTNRTNRNSTFDASEAKRDALFQSQDTTRQHAFDEAQELRQRTSQQSRQQRLQVVTQVAQQRRDLFSSGRARREKIYDEVETLSSLFDTLMETEETNFTQAQRERDARMDEIIKASLFRAVRGLY